MYKINVKSHGKYGNVELGARYTPFKKTAKRVINDFLFYECEIEVFRFIKCGDVWAWSDDHDLYGGIWYEDPADDEEE